MHPTRSGTGKWIYYMRHRDPQGKEKRWCLIGSDLSRIQILDPHYEEYLGILHQCVDEYYSTNVVKGPAAKDLIVKAVEKLEESGWDNTLLIEDKVKSDIIHYMATSHRA